MSRAAERPTPSSRPARVAMTVVPSFATTEEHVDAVRMVNHQRRQAHGRDLQYRLAVLGTDPADLVQHAGGLLFDHVMAGWSVTVLVPTGTDPRPLQILGTQVLDLDTALEIDLARALASPRHSPWPHKIVLGGDLCVRDARVREVVRRSFDHGETSTMMWAPLWSAVDQGNCTPIEHQLSSAARAFKSHALSATSATVADVPAAEVFLGNTVRTPSPPALHLV